MAIGQDGFLTFFGAEITAVAIEFFLRAVHQAGHLGDVVDIGCGGFNLPDQAGIPVNGDVTLVAEVPLIALLDLMRISFLVEEGAAISVESTIVPFISIRPLAFSLLTISAKSFSCSRF